MQKVHFYTLGCRLNQAETASLEALLTEKQFSIVRDAHSADIVVVNTCTVTAQADKDARGLINRIQRENPAAAIAVIGCQAETQKDVVSQWPGVKWVVGTASKMQLPEILAGDGSIIVTPIQAEPFRAPFGRVRPSVRTRANLKIQDGCDNFCAYCEIPYARGRSRSRVFDDLLAEARFLAEQGFKEIVLTGINVGLYSDSGKGLYDVVGALHDLKGLERIRISSIEHTALPQRLTEFMFPGGKLCRFLHIPLQHGSDSVLQKMGRKYSAAEFSDMVCALSATVRGIMIGTDAIVGFPGETEDDFQRMYDLLEQMPVQYFHVFTYSPRQNARSRNFDRPVPVAVAKKRGQALRSLSAKKKSAFIESQVGNVEKVLFEQKKRDYWIGLTDNYVTIKILSMDNLKNQVFNVRFDRFDNQALIGTVLRKVSHGPQREDPRSHIFSELPVL